MKDSGKYIVLSALRAPRSALRTEPKPELFRA